MWLEDMFMPGNYQQYRQLAEATSLSLTIGERIGGKMPIPPGAGIARGEVHHVRPGLVRGPERGPQDLDHVRRF